jgi:DNA replication initiation complex subunit (GINS family)
MFDEFGEDSEVKLQELTADEKKLLNEVDAMVSKMRKSYLRVRDERTLD